VLEHHADAEPARVRRIGDHDLLSFPLHASFGRCGDAVDDLHQRRLAGTVFAEYRVYLARFDRKVDAVVGDDTRVDLANPGELEAQAIVA
jgi:hypothetical protein